MISLSTKKQDDLIEKFRLHFSLKKTLDDVTIHHPKVTNDGCVHIDVGFVKENNLNYYFTFGCSAKLNRENRYVEVFIQSEDNIEYNSIIFNATDFNDKRHQLCLMCNNEYTYFDNPEHIMRELSDDLVCGFFIYDSFSVESFGKNVHYLELIPATKQELDYMEERCKKDHLNYTDVIAWFKPYLGVRKSIVNINGLSIEQMDKIIDSNKK